MILENEYYGNIKTKSLLEFGKGDIQVAPSTGLDHVSVLFRNDSVHEIGEDAPETDGTTSDEFRPDVVMTFDNYRSIDVVIDSLVKARKNLLLKGVHVNCAPDIPKETIEALEEMIIKAREYYA